MPTGHRARHVLAIAQGLSPAGAPALRIPVARDGRTVRTSQAKVDHLTPSIFNYDLITAVFSWRQL